jgi:hypothetical protein
MMTSLGFVIYLLLGRMVQSCRLINDFLNLFRLFIYELQVCSVLCTVHFENQPKNVKTTSLAPQAINSRYRYLYRTGRIIENQTRSYFDQQRFFITISN